MILQSMKMAVKSILSNKLRSFLTMLGIIIGVVALVVLVSLVNGATGSITDSINALGTNYLSVSIRDDHNQPIKYNELTEFVSAEGSLADQAAPVAQSSVDALNQSTEETTQLVGTTAAYADIQGLELESGRFLMKPDVDNHTNVVVINSDFALEIMGQSNVVGETVKLDGRAFEIIGVLAEDTSASSAMTEESSYEAYIPYTSMIRLTDTVGTDVTSFVVSVEGDDMDEAETWMENLLLERFSDDEDAYNIFNQSSIQEAMSSVTTTLSLLLGGIAGISLLVGGIGIMNIMLVSVTERTKEIGIRKAIGAGRGIIMLQFLIEALMVSLIGCLIGIAVSCGIIGIVNIVGNVSYTLSMGVAALSVAFSLGIGVVFGLYPANKAAKMKPIDALRFN